ncbi:glutamyl-tRNA reductase [Kiloniella sp. b19]|uniref:glutamyl-tRNA reductase n=1 Tax=Kiloniella sp. GXU_MW_B19 TaxID=3141326 RepID=UPI0031E46771
MGNCSGEREASVLGRLVVVGLNSRTAPLHLRESLFAEAPEAPDEILQALHAPDVSEGLLLATCERFDLIALARTDETPELDKAASFLLETLADYTSETSASLSSSCYCLSGKDALRHLFAVSASLDSQVVGEPQILGQVKNALRLARDNKAAGALLSGFLQASFTAAKRVRTETTIAQQAVTLAASACRLGQDIHGDPSRFSLLLIGGGDAGELLAREFLINGLASATIVHPRALRSRATALRLAEQGKSVRAEDWSDLDALLPAHDILLCGFHGQAGQEDRAFLDWQRLGEVMNKRRRKPLLILDVAEDGSVDPALRSMDGVFLYQLDDLVSVARQGRAQREAAMMDAWRILGAEMEALQQSERRRRATPAIVEFRKHVEELRQQVLDEQPDSAEQATHLLVNRLLHPVQEALREGSLSEKDEAEALQRTLRQLFGLEKPSDRG